MANKKNKKNKKRRPDADAGEQKDRAMRGRVMVELERERHNCSLALAVEHEQVLGEARNEADLIMRNANDAARAVIARAIRKAEDLDSRRISRLERGPCSCRELASCLGEGLRFVSRDFVGGDGLRFRRR